MDISEFLSGRLGGAAMPGHGLRGMGRPGIIQFGGGLPDPALNPVTDLERLFGEVLGGNEPGVLGYGHDQGDMRLREAIAERHRAEGAQMAAEGVAVTSGSAGGLGLVATALLDPGDVVVAEAATYPGALKAFRLMGAEIAAAPMDGDGLDPEALAVLLEGLSAEGRRVKFLYTVATCHNPTGGTMAEDRRRAVLALAGRHGMLVLEDNTYGAIRFSAPPPAFLALDPERTLHLGSFSKTIAPGLRAGWIAGRPDIVAAINSVRTDLGVSPLTQRVVTCFVQREAFPRRLEQLSAHYRGKRDRMLEGLERHCRGLAEWQAPEGGFFVWLHLTGCTAEAALDAGEAEGVSFMPGSYFAAEPGMLASHVRLSYGELAAEDIDEGLRRLGRTLERASA